MATKYHYVVVVCLALSWCASASAQMVLYDNFDASVIDPTKWTGTQFYDPDLREVLRGIAPTPGTPKDNRLHLMHRAYSAITDNTGSSGGLFGVSFISPSNVTAVSFSLVVNKLTLVGCKTNSAEDVTGAEFRGSFFNINPSPTDSSGDVIAAIGFGFDPTQGQKNVVAFVAENNGTILAYQIIGTWALGIANTLLVQWDQPNHQFIFQLGNGAKVFEPYSVPDTTPPFSPFKNLDVARVVPHCTSTPRPYAFVDADFDTVYVN